MGRAAGDYLTPVIASEQSSRGNPAKLLTGLLRFASLAITIQSNGIPLQTNKKAAKDVVPRGLFYVS